MISAELFNKQLMSFPFSDTWVKLITKGGSLSETSRRVFQEHFILNISWATDFLWKIMLCFSIFRLAFRHPIPIFPVCQRCSEIFVYFFEICFMAHQRLLINTKNPWWAAVRTRAQKPSNPSQCHAPWPRRPPPNPNSDYDADELLRCWNSAMLGTLCCAFPMDLLVRVDKNFNLQTINLSSQSLLRGRPLVRWRNH